MARAIDSEVAFRFLTEQIVKETGAFSKGVNKGLNIARSAIRNPDAIPTLTPPNEPLTLDELREMNGQPVWVKCLKPDKYTYPPVGWRILELSFTGKFGVWNGDCVLIERDYGTDWLAYRRPPEGEEEA